MTIEILDLAEEDIYRGYVFYEKQECGGWERGASRADCDSGRQRLCRTLFGLRSLGSDFKFKI